MAALATATTYRRLLWQGTVPLQISLAPSPNAVNTSGVNSYFIQAPRHSYLPLLLADIRDNFVDLVLDEAASASYPTENWWFEDESGATVKWYWPLGLVSDYALASAPGSSSRPFPPPASSPLGLTLHLTAPTEKHVSPSNSIDACRTTFMSSVKEADFVRWGNVKRVTGLRRPEQDALWDGVRTDDYELHSRIIQRIFPLPHQADPATPNPSSTTPSSFHAQQQLPSRPPSTEPGGQSSIGSSSNKPDSGYAVRSVPVKVYLPEGAGVIQDILPPYAGANGAPTTLISHLQLHLPLLFPASYPEPYALAFPILHGIVPSPETEMAWIGACCAGADGWIAICISVRL